MVLVHYNVPPVFLRPIQVLGFTCEIVNFKYDKLLEKNPRFKIFGTELEQISIKSGKSLVFPFQVILYEIAFSPFYDDSL